MKEEIKDKHETNPSYCECDDDIYDIDDDDPTYFHTPFETGARACEKYVNNPTPFNRFMAFVGFVLSLAYLAILIICFVGLLGIII